MDKKKKTIKTCNNRLRICQGFSSSADRYVLTISVCIKILHSFVYIAECGFISIPTSSPHMSCH